MIRKLPNKNRWVLKSKTTGKKLGVFKSKTDAQKRERQINYFKNLNRRKKK